MFSFDQRSVRPTQVYESPAKEIKFTRVFCGAMFFPTIATIVGKLMFRNVDGNLQRSMLVTTCLFNTLKYWL